MIPNAAAIMATTTQPHCSLQPLRALQASSCPVRRVPSRIGERERSLERSSQHAGRPLMAALAPELPAAPGRPPGPEAAPQR